MSTKNTDEYFVVERFTNRGKAVWGRFKTQPEAKEMIAMIQVKYPKERWRIVKRTTTDEVVE